VTRTTRAAAWLCIGALTLAACGDDRSGVIARSAVPTPTTAEPPPGAVGPTGSTTAESVPSTSTVPTTEVPVTTVPLEDIDVTEPPIIEPELSVSIPIDNVVDVDTNKPARDYDGFVAAAFTDVERWWAEVYPEVYGEEFVPLEGGVYAGYPERQTEIPGCGQRRTAYDDLQLFVAFYCNVGDFMAYDDGDGEFSLLAPLAATYGPAVLGVVLAHEYGHAIQERIGALDRPLATIVTEQQADCFAGAWTGQAYRGESDILRLGDSDVRAGLLAMLEVRDPVGTSQFTPGGHGSAFDRVGAFQVGFNEGPARCAELLDDVLPLMPNEFRSLDDEFLEGNAPYDCDELDPSLRDQLFPNGCTSAPFFLADDINHFWRVAFAGDFEPFEVFVADTLDAVTCPDARIVMSLAAICVADRSLIYVEPDVRELYDEFGDFTLGYVYGVAASEFAQVDIDSPLEGEQRALLNDCFTGAWVRDITPDSTGRRGRSDVDLDGDGEEDTTVVSSPGDLDEAIRMAILLGDLGANVDQVGSAFEKIDAFRTGVLGGLDACRARLLDR
jgi:predicted metalloprotease